MDNIINYIQIYHKFKIGCTRRKCFVLYFTVDFSCIVRRLNIFVVESKYNTIKMLLENYFLFTQKYNKKINRNLKQVIEII